jgi:hypothetical protein
MTGNGAGTEKTSRPPADRHRSVVSLRLYPDMEPAVAAWTDRHPDPNPPVAIRRLIEKGLKADGSLRK